MGVEPYLVAAIGALATVVTVLWRVDIANRNKEQAELRAALADAVVRIRALEESRLNAAIQRGDEMKALAEKFVKEVANNSMAFKELQAAFATFSKALATKTCMHELEPSTITDRPDTGNIAKK